MDYKGKEGLKVNGNKVWHEGNFVPSSKANKNETPIKKNIANTTADYTDFVIPLCSLDNTYISADHFAQGTVFLKRSNILSGQITSIDIICGKNYNSENPVFSILKSNNSNLIKPVTFIYNSIKYFGLHAKITGSSYTGQHYFIGNASDMSIINGIYVYNNNTSTIMNNEIYNSLVFIADSSLQKEIEFFKSPILRPMGDSAIYKIWNETNDGSGSGLDADTVDGKHAPDFATAVHTHDDRYYTESEVDTKLNTKANVSHTHTASDLPSASTSAKGVVQLSSSVSSTSTTLAATASAAKAAYDKANHSHPYAPTTHTHTKSQITDMPTKLSQFENDIGAGAGLNIVCSATEPVGLNPGDWWYKEV